MGIALVKKRAANPRERDTGKEIVLMLFIIWVYEVLSALVGGWWAVGVLLQVGRVKMLVPFFSSEKRFLIVGGKIVTLEVPKSGASISEKEERSITPTTDR